jgi:hypothetical protein
MTSLTPSDIDVQMSTDELSREEPSFTTQSIIGKRVRAETIVASTTTPTGRPPTSRVRTDAETTAQISAHATVPPPPSSPPIRAITAGPSAEDSDYDLSEEEDDDLSNRDMLKEINTIMGQYHAKQDCKVENLKKRIAILEKQVAYLVALTGADPKDIATQPEDFVNTPVQAPKSTPIPWNTVASQPPAAQPTDKQPKEKGKRKAETPSTSKDSSGKPNPTSDTVKRSQRQIVILRETEPKESTFQAMKIRDAANKALSDAKAPPALKVASATRNARGNVILLTKDDCTSQQVMQFKGAIETALKKADPKIKSIQSSEHWTKLIIHGIDTIYFPDTKDGMEKLKTELETYNSKVKLAMAPRYLTRPEKRRNKTNTSAVIAFKENEAASYILRNGVMAMGVHHKAEKFYSARPWDQCMKCQGFGHHWQRCDRVPACRLCAQEHETKDHKCDTCPTRGKKCSHTTLCCANCEGPHTASDPGCDSANAIAARNARKEAGAENINAMKW